MKSTFNTLLFTFMVLFCAFTMDATAQIPKTINYQGALALPNNEPVPDAQYNVTFRMYDSETNGNELWAEQQTVVTFQGVFDAILGNKTLLNLAFDKPYWLSVQIEGQQEMTPRVPLVSVPFALSALKAINADSATFATKALLSDSASVAGHSRTSDTALIANEISDNAKNVVLSLNNLQGRISILGEGGTTVSTVGNTLRISSTSTGITTITSTDGSIKVTLTSTGADVEIADGSIGTTKIQNGAITSNKLATGVIPTSLPPSGSAGGDLTGSYPNPTLAPKGAANGQVLKWTGTAWQPANDDGQIYNAGSGISINGSTISNTGDTDPNNDITTSTTAGGDLVGLYPNPTIAQKGAASGQVLKWNGTSWQPDNDNGQVYNAGRGISINGALILNTGDADSTNDVTITSTAGGDVSGVFSNLKVEKIQNVNVSSTTPTNGQLLQFNATTNSWEPVTINTGSSGVAGGDLAGTYPNPTIAQKGASNGQVLGWNGSAWIPVTPQTSGNAGGDLTGTYPNPTLAQKGATNNQVLKWNGTSWQPANDDGQTYTAGTGINITAGVVTNTGDTDASNDITNSTTAAGDLTGTYPAPTIAQKGATSGQVLKWNGTAWTPSTDNGDVYTAGDAINITAGAIGVTDGSITTAKLANNAVTTAKITDANVTTPKLADGSVTSTKLNQMSATSGQVLKWNGTSWQPANDDGQTYTAGTGINITSGVVTNTGDTDASNDITNSTTAAGDLTGTYPAPTIAQKGATNGQVLGWNGSAWIPVTPQTSGSAGGDLTGTYPNPTLAQKGATNGQVLKWNGTAWTPSTDNGDVYTAGDAINITAGAIGVTDGSITTAKLANNAVTTAKITDANVTTPKLADGSVTSAKLNQMSATSGQSLVWNGTAWTPTTVSASGTAGGDLSGTYPNPNVVKLQTRDVSSTAPTSGQVLKWNGTAWTPSTDNGDVYTAGDAINITAGAIGVTDGSITTAKLATNAVTTAKITDANVTTPKLADGSVTSAKLNQMSATSGQSLVWNGTAWTPTTVTTSGTAGGDLSGTYPNPNVVKLQTRDVSSTAPTSGQVLKWNGTAWTPSTDNGDVYTAGDAINITAGAIGVTDGSITTAKLATNAVTTVKINDANVTTPKLADGSVTSAKLNQMSATSGQVLKWNGTAWTPSTDNGDVYTAGDAINITAGAIGVTDGSITTAKLATNAVTTVKITDANVTTPKLADGSVTSAKLNQMSATSGQVLKWNGTAWIPSTDNGDVYTAGDAINITAGAIGVTDGSITTAKLANNAVTTAKITDANITTPKLADGSVTSTKLNQMSATTGQSLVWNGTAWTPTTVSASGTAGGDLSGTYPNPNVVKLQTRDVSSTAPTSGQVLKWNGTAWTPSTDNGDVYTAGDAINITAGAIGVTDGSITTAKLATNAVTTAKITDANVTTPKLADGSVTSAKLNQMSATNGQTLVWNGTAWTPTTVSASGTAGGDLSGTYPNPNVVKLQNRNVAATAPTNGQVLKWNNTTSVWEPGADNNTTYTAGAGISIAGNVISNSGDTDASNDITNTTTAGGDLSGTYPNPNVVKLQTRDVSSTAPTTGQALVWNGTAWAPSAVSVSGSAGGDLTGTYPNPSVAVNAITTAKILDGNVTTSKLSDGSVTSAKLNQMSATSGQSLVWNGTAWTPTTVTTSGTAGGDLSGTYPNPNVVKLQTRDVSSTAPTSGQSLVWNGTAWTPTTVSASGTAGGDLSGTYPNPNVVKLQNRNVASTSPTNGQVLKWNNTTSVWEPSADNNNTYTAGAGISIAGNVITNTGDTDASNDITNTTTAGGDLSGTYPNPNVVKLQTRDVSSTAPTTGQVLKWNGTAWTPSTDAGGSGDVTTLGTVIDNQLTRYHNTSGDTIQSSAIVIDDYTTTTQNNVAIKADDGATADITLVLAPKGNGALSADKPNGVAAGGNARGIAAVDFQMERSAATHVASGDYSTIGGGYANTASGNYSTVAGGYQNSATAFRSSVTGGYLNVAGNTNSVVAGGHTNNSSGAQSAILGGSDNVITSTANNSSIVGGSTNTLEGSYSTILGGVGLRFTGSYNFGFNGLTTTADSAYINSSRVGYFGNVDLWLGNTNGSASSLKFFEAQASDGTFPAAGTNYTAFKAGTQTTDVTYTLPTAAPASNGQVLSSTTAGTMSWVTPSTGTGDVTTLGTVTDNQLTRYHNTSGDTIQSSAIVIDDYTTTTQNNVAIKADDGATADISLVLAPKGNGALTADKPDGTTAGGNARGTNAVDFQMVRVAGNQVASGDNSFIGAGSRNKATGGNTAVVSGYQNTANQGAILTGQDNTVSGAASAIAGGYGNTVGSSGSWSAILAGYQNTVNAATSSIVGGNKLTLGGVGSLGFNGKDSAVVGAQYTAYFGNVDVWLGNTDTVARSLRFYEAQTSSGNFPAAGTNYTAFKAGTQATDVTYTLPTAAPTSNGQVLSSTTGGTMSWVTPSTGTGDVITLGTVTDNQLTRYHNATGDTVQGSAIVIDDYTTTTQNNVAIKADDGSTANISLVMAPKGTGALIASKPDGTATGGNARGANAVDLQTVRANAAYVASGNYSVIAGGAENRATALYSTVGGGYNHIASDTGATIAGGNQNWAQANYATVGGGSGNRATADYGTVAGGNSNDASGQYSFAGGGKSNNASGQYGVALGGLTNQADGVYSTVINGTDNIASGDISTILGGTKNITAGNYTIVGGHGLNFGSNADNSFGYHGYNVLSDSVYINTSNIAYFGNVDMWLGNTRNTASQLKFFEPQSTDGTFPAAGTNYTAFKAGTQTTDVTYTLPTAAPASNGQVLSSTTTGTMSWVTPSTGTGDVVTLGTVTDNQLTRYHNTSGDTIQSSAIVIDDYTTTTQNNVAIKADNGAALDISLVLVPKGNGALISSKPDGTATGGNARGMYAVDLQLNRAAASQVANGAYATVLGGRRNTANGQYSIVSGGDGNTIGAGGLVATVSGGSSNTATNTWSTIGGGNTNTATGVGTTIGGGQNNQASNSYSVVAGGLTDTASGDYSVVSGGTANVASGTSAVVSGGELNKATGNQTTILGGFGLRLGGTGSFGFNGFNTVADSAFVSNDRTAYFGNVDLWLGNTDNTTSELRFFEAQSTDGIFPAAGTNYTAFKAGTQTADVTYTLPTAYPTVSGQVLSSTTVGVMSWVTASSGLTHFTESVNTSAPNVTVPVVRLLATNAATNVDVALSPKGSGALTGNVADNTLSGGNKRGTYAVDWQLNRSAANQVASGNWSVLSGGAGNVSSGLYSTVGGGWFNQATNQHAVVGGGEGNSATAAASSVLGGSGNIASGQYSAAVSGWVNTASGGYSNITGGDHNTTSGSYSNINGGGYNTAGANYTVIGGGYLNIVAADYTSIAGGYALRMGGVGSFGFNGFNALTDSAYITANRTAYLGNVDLWLGNTDNTTSELRFYEAQSTDGTFPAAGTNYTAFKAGTQTADVTYTLPTAAPASNGQVLSSTTTGTMSWVTAGGGDVTGPASSVDNALARYDGTTGKIIQNSGLILDDYSTATQANVTLRADSGSVANISMVLSPKGTGALLANKPNGAVTGGNARGINAVDLQTSRTASTQVASGDYTVILGGSDNTATGTASSILGGYDNTASGSFSVISGGFSNSNTTISSYSVIGGGLHNSVSDGGSTVGGGVDNSALAQGSAIAGGGRNYTNQNYGSISGGFEDTINTSATYATISGGQRNKITASLGSIGGGKANTVSGDYSTIAGGYSLRQTGIGSFGFNGYNTIADSAYVSANRTAYFGNVDLWLGNTDNTTSELRFFEAQSTDGTFPAAGTNYTGFKAGTQTADITYTLPVAAPASNGQVLSSTTGGVMSWVTAGSGDVTGPSASVNNAIARFDGTTGKIIQNSGIVIDDTVTVSAKKIVTLRAEDNTTANITLSLLPKGTGALTASKPDGTAFGGNIRGDYAVDLQTSRGTGTQVASGNYSVISGGKFNTASGLNSTIAGGSSCVASGNYSFVSSGLNNVANGLYSAIGGGSDNYVTQQGSSISGGSRNYVNQDFSTIGGGIDDTINTAAIYSTIAGGQANKITANRSAIGGGYGNYISGASGTIAGGYLDTVSGTFAVVAGGYKNNVSGSYSTISSGYVNYVSSQYSAILGGANNDVTANYSSVLGGQANTANGQYNLVFGNAVVPTVTENYRVYFFEPTSYGFLGINREDLDYPIHVGTSASNGNGAYLTTGGVWTNGSSRTFKDRYTSLDSAEVLKKVRNLDVRGWWYKGTQEYHVGPFAEDFRDAFGTGVLDNTDSRKYLAATDIAGVALYSSQQLIKQNEQLFSENERMKSENESIKLRLERLESIISNKPVSTETVTPVQQTKTNAPRIVSIAPDPAGNYAVVKFELPKAANVELFVSAGNGTRTLDIMSGVFMQAGTYDVEVNLNDVANGWYVCELRASAESAQRLFRVVK